MLGSLLLRSVAFLLVLLLVCSMMLLLSLWVSAAVQLFTTTISAIVGGLSG